MANATIQQATPASSLTRTWAAGTLAPFTANCKCINAEYALNSDGTVQVNNSCEANGKASNILGTASPADAAYGTKGVFRVQFPDYANDIALVQSNNFSTLFILSRQQQLEDSVIDAWIERAGLLGTNLDKVVKTDQSNCLFT
uniref:Lipocalin/cytosolic fatty-acid binding domain-containing protein n=1 Tax=Bionectria ochroleuca TaxID=29856 RepID=A0A0B7K8X2_BIOOC